MTVPHHPLCGKEIIPTTALEATAEFKAYNQAIEDALGAIRESSQGGGHWAATFINAIARKCSPHVYATRAASLVQASVPAKGEKDYQAIATRNFRWAYQLLIALAKRRLADANATRESKDDWPAGQEWHEMVGTSHSIFLRGAREEAGIPEEAFMGVIRSLECDVDDLYENAAVTPSPTTPASLSAEREFLNASIAVWREIDRLSESPEGYKGLDASTELRRRERAAWEKYKASLTTPANVPVGEPDVLVDEVQHRMDLVVEAAVEWHQAGQEGGEWFEAAEKLGASINSLLELRGDPQSAMPRRHCSVHNREEFKYESLEHELHAASVQPTSQQAEVETHTIGCARLVQYDEYHWRYDNTVPCSCFQTTIK